MPKAKIEWCDYTINPVKGLCPMACPYCYARRMYKRFKWNPEIRFEPEVFEGLCSIGMDNPSKIFVGSTIELFCDEIPPEWLKVIFKWCGGFFTEHTFIFLTKQPHNLIKWSPFPDNCWVGVSVTANGDMTNAYYGLNRVQAGKRFISFEPLLGQIGFDDHVKMKSYVDWVIIGSQTPYSPKTAPRIEWVQEIVAAADKVGIPVFLKNNLVPIIAGNKSFKEADPMFIYKDGGYYTLRQELPNKLSENKGVVYLQSQV